jgi:circadian clock protein KaiC
VLTGSARLVQEAKDKARTVADRQASQQRERELKREQADLRNQADALAKRLEAIGTELRMAKTRDTERQQSADRERRGLARARNAD